jgi:hypothetical protein
MAIWYDDDGTETLSVSSPSLPPHLRNSN